MASGLRKPQPTYKRSTRVAPLDKEEELPYSKKRGEGRRSEAPAFTTKCLSRWWFGAVILSVIVPLFGTIAWVPSGIPRSRRLPACWCAVGWTLIRAIMICGSFRIIIVPETCHRSGRWRGGSRPTRSGRQASGYPVSRDPRGNKRSSWLVAFGTIFSFLISCLVKKGVRGKSSLPHYSCQRC